MSNLILLFLCLALGVLFKKIKLFPLNASVALNTFVINISLTALSLFYIPKIKLGMDVIYPVLVGWIGIIFSIIFFSILGKKLGWKRTVTGAIILCAGFGNTSFVGIPVIQSIYGENGIKTVMMVDQPGFVALSTIGILVANIYSGGKTSAGQLAKRILKFPPFIAFLIAFLMNIFQLQFPKDLDDVFQKLGATTVPLALISVGLQLYIPKFDKSMQPLLWGLLFKLILFPLLVFILYFIVFGQRGEVIEISVLEAGMAPMITAAIIASAHNLEPKLCNAITGIGIPFSFATLAGWYFFMQWFH